MVWLKKPVLVATKTTVGGPASSEKYPVLVAKNEQWEMVQLPMIYSLFLTPLKWLEMVQLPMKNILFWSPLKWLEMSTHTPPSHQLT